MSKRLGRSVRRRGIVAAGVAAAVGVFAVATALPAAAHDETLSGQSVCSDGAHLITWAIGNTNTPLAMHIVTATATLNGAQQFPVLGAVGSDVPANGSITATTTVPGNLTGTVFLDVFGQWPDGVANEIARSVDLTSQCSPTDTTSTSTSSSSSTTSSTASTTSTTESTTSTTTAPTTTSTEVEGTTTVPSSTTVSSTPITGEGSTVASSTTVPSGSLGSTATTAPTSGTTASGGSLPFTGSTDSGPIVGLTSLVAGAFALVFARRRHSRA